MGIGMGMGMGEAECCEDADERRLSGGCRDIEGRCEPAEEPTDERRRSAGAMWKALGWEVGEEE